MNIFKRKLRSEDLDTIIEITDKLSSVKVGKLANRLDRTIEAIDVNGLLSEGVVSFLLDKSGYGFYQLNERLTDKELKSLGDCKMYVVKDVLCLIAKKSKMQKKLKTKKK